MNENKERQRRKIGKAKIIFIVIFVINIPLIFLTDINQTKYYIAFLVLSSCFLSIPSIERNVPGFNCDPNRFHHGDLIIIFGCTPIILAILGVKCCTSVARVVFNLLLLFYNLIGNELIAKLLFDVIGSKISSTDRL